MRSGGKFGVRDFWASVVYGFGASLLLSVVLRFAAPEVLLGGPPGPLSLEDSLRNMMIVFLAGGALFSAIIGLIFATRLSRRQASGIFPEK